MHLGECELHELADLECALLRLRVEGCLEVRLQVGRVEVLRVELHLPRELVRAGLNLVLRRLALQRHCEVCERTSGSSVSVLDLNDLLDFLGVLFLFPSTALMPFFSVSPERFSLKGEADAKSSFMKSAREGQRSGRIPLWFFRISP